ncbi:hypothetical protein D3C73_1323790 [compost metagenome]
MRQRNAGIGRTAGRRGNTGNNRERDTFVAQGFQLFATATKDEQVAAFQAHYAFALFRLVQQDLVDLFLRYAVITRTLADENTIGIATNKVHDVIGNQAVIHHDISLLDLL